MSNIFDLTNKIAVVTGASSGLGVQMAHALARQGADLTILARREDRLRQVQQDIIEQHQVEVLVASCDVTKPEQIDKAAAQTKEKYGKVDILVNNAGVAGMGEAEELTLDEWQKALDVNLTGVFLCSQKFGELMIEQEYGKIINIASIFGVRANLAFPVSAYHASKAGVVNFTRALATEWAKYNITVNGIGPGFFKTEMTVDVEKDPNADAYIKAGCPMNRWGKKGELDGALILLASEASSFITGQTILVDGGWTAA